MAENENCCGPGKDNTNAKTVKIKPRVKTSNIPGSVGSIQKEKTCCCSGTENCSLEPITKFNKNDHWVIGEINTDAGSVPQVSTQLAFADVLGAWKVRWGINRMDYKINPGVYAVGNPHKDSHVLVTANYKLTFDVLRKELAGLNVWILVLDTKGVNVWCAAGKGTFGTKELINRIGKTRLSQIVTHRTLILPQLGAPGVSAHEVTKHTGFKVVYGTVRAKDIKAFINSGMKATDEMRMVKFNTYDRLVLTPMELVGALKASLIIFGVLFLINLISPNPFGMIDFYAYTGALIIGCVVMPVLLPLIPGRAFAWKGWLLGLVWAIGAIVLNGWPQSTSLSFLKGSGYLLVLPSISAYYAMNFTGSSTYTSFSGVLKEMRIAVPLITISVGLGSILLLVASFFGI